MAKTIQYIPDEQEVENKLFFTVEEMSKISGIGQNFLRSLIDENKIDFICIGNKRLIMLPIVKTTCPKK